MSDNSDIVLSVICVVALHCLFTPITTRFNTFFKLYCPHNPNKYVFVFPYVSAVCLLLCNILPSRHPMLDQCWE